MPDRATEVAAFYAANRDRLLHTVERVVIAPPTIVEDACQYAWTQVVRRDDIDLDRRGFWWLHRVAVREARKLTQYNRHIVDLNAVPDDLEVEAVPINLIASTENLEETVARREVIALVDLLPERQRRYVFMRSMGLSYAEMARITGDSVVTVGRQLCRAYANLRQLRARLE